MLWRPIHGARFRWTPMQGKASCALEHTAQAVWTHRIALYIALVTTLTLAVMLFGVPDWVPGSP